MSYHNFPGLTLDRFLIQRAKKTYSGENSRGNLRLVFDVCAVTAAVYVAQCTKCHVYQLNIVSYDTRS